MSEEPKPDLPPLSAREIRTLRRSDSISLSRIRNELYPRDKVQAAGFAKDVNRLLQGGGRAWIMRRESIVAGYASVIPAPGLPGVYELDGFVALAHQRQGLASFLLRTIIRQLANSAVRQLFHAVPSSITPAAQFLVKNGFYVEHEEQYLILEAIKTLPAAQYDPTFSLQTFGQHKAINLFRHLYEASFAGQPWYQPYDNEEEVARDLSDPDDLLFLAERGRPIGFVWLRWPDQRLTEIEPVGLLPSYRGRGLGKQLMLSGLAQAAQQGAEQAQVGVWSQNTSALRLYESLGFRVTGRNLFLALDV